MRRFLPVLLAAALTAACNHTPAPPAASAPAASAPAFQGTDLRREAEQIGGDFTLTDSKGQAFALGSLKGKAVILAFGFTHCPDVCPTELLSYKDALAQLGGQAKDVAVVFVSIDPERDSPELIGKYVAQFHPDFIGLTATDPQQLAEVKQQYRIVAAKTEIQSDTAYNMDHTAGAYLLDKNGRVAAFEPYGADAAQIAADLRLLLKS